jgi:hypothetical protein
LARVLPDRQGDVVVRLLTFFRLSFVRSSRRLSVPWFENYNGVLFGEIERFFGGEAPPPPLREPGGRITQNLNNQKFK